MYGVAYEPDGGAATIKDGVMCCVTGCGRPTGVAGLGVAVEGAPADADVTGPEADPLTEVTSACRRTSRGMVNGPGGLGSA